jgi:putative ABC transport system permease protein
MILHYLKIAAKVLARRKFFTFISLFGIAFTLMVLTVATSLLDSALAPLPPETRFDRTLLVMRARMTGPHSIYSGSPGYTFLDRYVRGLPGAERVSIVTRPGSVVTYLDGRKVRLQMRLTDGDYWRILEFEFLEGGPYSVEDDRDGNKVAVINESLRDRLFGGASAVGRSVEVGGQTLRIVGVVRNVPATRILPFADLWAPLGTQPPGARRQGLLGDCAAMILAKDRADFPALKAEFDARVREVPIPDPKNYDRFTSSADTLFDYVSRTAIPTKEEERRPGVLAALIVFGAVLFMALPAINLVNINLSRILERASEIGVRKAFGASSRALVGQFIVENVFLTLVGALIAWIFALGVLRGISESGVIPYARLELNLRVLAWGVVIALFFGVMSGLYPAWRMSRLHPVEALRGRSE